MQIGTMGWDVKPKLPPAVSGGFAALDRKARRVAVSAPEPPAARVPLTTRIPAAMDVRPLPIHRALAVVMAAALLAGCGRDGDIGIGGGSEVIRFSILAPGSSPALSKAWAPIVKDMETSTGLSVKTYFSNDESALVESFRGRHSDLGWFSNPAGLEAVRRGGGEVFARAYSSSAVDGYASVLVVNAKSKLTLDQVLKCDRSLTLAMGDAGSIAGALAVETYLFAPRQIRPAACFKPVREAGPQTNLAAVAAGKVDVATSRTDLLADDRRDPHRGAAADAVRVIWTSPILPQNPLIWRKDLDPAIKEKVRQFFLTYGQENGPAGAAQRANLARLGIAGFRPADDSHLLPMREMEATRAWLDAKAGGDKAKIEAARRALDSITAQRQDLEARTRAPAAAQ